MRRTRSVHMGVKAAVVGILVLGAAGCDRDLAGELTVLSGTYLGDIAKVVVTDCVYGTLGVESGASSDEHADEDEHSHDTEPLHDHEH